MDMRRLVTVFLLSTAAAGAQRAAAATVTLVLKAQPPVVASSRTAGFTLTYAAGAAAAKPHSGTISLPGASKLDVPDGAWSLHVDAPGYLSVTRVIQAMGETSVPVVMAQATKVTGALRHGAGGEEIDALTLTYRYVDPPGDGIEVSGTTECVVRQPRFECTAPIGLTDYNLHARGFASHYGWGEKLTPGRVTDVGTSRSCAVLRSLAGSAPARVCALERRRSRLCCGRSRLRRPARLPSAIGCRSAA